MQPGEFAHPPRGEAGDGTRDQPLAPVLERNIRALLARRKHEEKTKEFHVRVSDAITRFAGSMRSVYLHAAFFGTWIVCNLPWTPLPKFDPSFVVLAMMASVEAIFLTTFVLISQNRMSDLAEKRAELDLQISLLAEHEITRLLQLTTAIAERAGVPQPPNEDLEPLKRDVDPEAVLDEIEHPRNESNP